MCEIVKLFTVLQEEFFFSFLKYILVQKFKPARGNVCETGPNDPALVMVLTTLEVTNVDVVDRETDVVFIRSGLVADEVVVMGGATVDVLINVTLGTVIMLGEEL